MANYIVPSYTFIPGRSGMGTLDLLGISNFDVKRLVKVTNQTHGVVIYKNDDADLKYVAVTGSTLKLLKDTSYMNSTDILQILYEG